MFKRVEKRRRKKVEEEELGLDEDMKEILGMHDTDSDESESDSDQSSAGDVEEEQEEDLSDTGGFGEGSDSDQDEDKEERIITVQEALRDPIYLVSIQPNVKACIVCPGKLLKGAKMVELHRTSKAHERRVKQFKTMTAGVNSKENARDIIRRNTGGHPKALTPSENSKRAEKRKAKLEAHQAKRAKQKAKLRTKNATPIATKPNVVSTTHPQENQKLKKRKIDKTASTTSKSEALVSSENVDDNKNLTGSTIKSIVRSTSQRAKLARARFLKSSKDLHNPVHHKLNEDPFSTSMFCQ